MHEDNLAAAEDVAYVLFDLWRFPIDTILPELARLGALRSIGWIRGEWHYRKQNPVLASALVRTHANNIDLNLPHEVGLFIAHRL